MSRGKTGPDEHNYPIVISRDKMKLYLGVQVEFRSSSVRVKIEFSGTFLSNEQSFWRECKHRTHFSQRGTQRVAASLLLRLSSRCLLVLFWRLPATFTVVVEC